MSNFTVHFISYDLTPTYSTMITRKGEEQETDFTFDVHAERLEDAYNIALETLDEIADYYGVCVITSIDDVEGVDDKLFY